MRRTITLLSALVLMLAMTALPAAAQEAPEHGHVLLVGADFEANPGPGSPWIVHSFHKCVEIANARPLGVQAHHHTIHQGRAGEALRGAGHLTVPLSPLTGFTSCADVEAALG